MNDKKQNNVRRNWRQEGDNPLVYGKVPPHNSELEKAVLGAIMLERDALDIAGSIVSEDCFYVDAHRKIFKAIVNLNEKGAPIDLLTVTEELRAAGELELVGGAYAMMQLTMNVVTAAHIEAHSRVIAEKYIQRELIKICGNVVAEAYSDGTDALELFDKTETELFGISKHFFSSSYKNAKALAIENAGRIEALQNRTIDLNGVSTGYSSLNALTCGWQPSDLIIIAARPSVGKTAFALNLAVHAMTDRDNPVGVGLFSLEMGAQQITNRIISYMGSIDMSNLTRGRMSDAEYQQYLKANNDFSKLNLVIDDTAAITLQHLRTKARQMVSKEKVGLIIIDYLQLMTGDSRQGGNREQEISKISRGLKALAKDLNIPIIALSQLSRAVETRKGEPMLSDLRESGAIEQDADIVSFLMRDDYQQNGTEVDPMLANKASIKFAKHRNGSLEKLAFTTDLKYQRWDEYRPEYINPNPSAGIRPHTSFMPPANPSSKLYIEGDLPF